MKKVQKSSLAMVGAVIAGAVLSTASAVAGNVTTERLINSEKEPGN